MSCPYQYYIDDKQYLAKLYCKLVDKGCIYSKRCDNVHRFIPMDNQEECYLYNLEKQKKIPNGSYYIKTKRLNSKKDRLYVYIDIDGITTKILTDFAEINQDYIYIKKGAEGYKVSLTSNFPKEESVAKVQTLEEAPQEENIEEKVDIETTKVTSVSTNKKSRKRNLKTK